MVERESCGVAAAAPTILVLEAHDLPGVLVVDETPPKAADAAGACERFRIIDEAENIEANFDGKCGEKVDLELGCDDGREVSQFAEAEEVGKLRDKFEPRRLCVLGEDERQMFEQLRRIVGVNGESVLRS